ncbi:MAG UNVERIFIED_CONTAM: hypothetical protein LVT10_09175 [Anaerolineae bacterium]
MRVNEQTGRPANLLQYALGSIVLLGGVGYALAWVSAGNPIAFEFPTASRFNFSGGQSLSGEYLGLFLGLSLYTSAFIADIVRAGIQSVPYGQIEASRALGLTNRSNPDGKSSYPKPCALLFLRSPINISTLLKIPRWGLRSGSPICIPLPTSPTIKVVKLW